MFSARGLQKAADGTDSVQHPAATKWCTMHGAVSDITSRLFNPGKLPLISTVLFAHTVMPGFTTFDVRLMFAGIKAIKLHAWEAPFEKRINHLREVEMQQIR